jgi:multifunctional beta-oxidation protein
VLEAWNEITKFNKRKELIFQGPTEQKISHQDVLENIERLKNTTRVESTYTFNDKDVILYSTKNPGPYLYDKYWQASKDLGVGAKRPDLSLLFESSPNFQVLPTFGAVPFFSPSVISRNSEIVPEFDVMRMLHGEHYLEIRKFPIPTSGTLTSTPRLLKVVDKDNAAITITGYTTKDSQMHKDIFYNEISFFIQGSGGFGGHDSSVITDRPVAASLTHTPPPRQPNAVVEDKTSDEQAALYRLSGDRMAIHIDPAFSARAGFQTPILHGLCFFGFAGRHVFEQYGLFRNIKVRFAGTVLPGQTIRTEMWKEGNRKVIFQTRVLETGKLCIVGGLAELVDGSKNKL